MPEATETKAERYPARPQRAVTGIAERVLIIGLDGATWDVLGPLMERGLIAEPTDGVATVLGREPRTFEDYVLRTAATGVWSR